MSIPVTIIIIVHQIFLQSFTFLKTLVVNNYLQIPAIFIRNMNLKFIISFILFFSIALSAASNHSAYQSMVPVTLMARNIADLITFFSLLLSIRLLFMALYDIKRAWRIGINEKEQTALITNGIYYITRNPLLVTYFFTILAYSLMIPCLGVIFSGITVLYFGNNIIIYEEKYLLNKHKQIYKKYIQEVGRYL